MSALPLTRAKLAANRESIYPVVDVETAKELALTQWIAEHRHYGYRAE